jgi:hypothetical protein
VEKTRKPMGGNYESGGREFESLRARQPTLHEEAIKGSITPGQTRGVHRPHRRRAHGVVQAKATGPVYQA